MPVIEGNSKSKVLSVGVLSAPTRPAAPVMNPAKRPSLPGNGQSTAPVLTACDFVLQGDGSYRAVPRKPRDKVTVREAARLANYSLGAVYRLYNAGFIKGERQSPRRILIGVESLQAHLEAVRDPGFWTDERKLRYWGV